MALPEINWTKSCSGNKSLETSTSQTKAQKFKSVIITTQRKTTSEYLSECSNEMKQFIAKKAFNGNFDCIINFAEYYSFSKKQFIAKKAF